MSTALAQIGKFIADVFEVDIEGTTNLLMRTSKAWHEKDKQAPNNTVGIAHYHGTMSRDWLILFESETYQWSRT